MDFQSRVRNENAAENCCRILKNAAIRDVIPDHENLPFQGSLFLCIYIFLSQWKQALHSQLIFSLNGEHQSPCFKSVSLKFTSALQL